MKASVILYTLFMSLSFAAPKEFKLLHYNIRELDSKKLSAGPPQLDEVKKILSKIDYDILSLNEIQYDLPGVPTAQFQTEGQNIQKLQEILELSPDWQSTFHPANTGMKARKNDRGEYEIDPNSPQARELADQINFGTFPGQYSTGALFKFPKNKEIALSNIQWRHFNPQIDLKKYAQDSGAPLPEEMELFDKNFTDVELLIHGEKVHLVLFHAVPSFHFGNMKSPNYARNRDQLRFLEWYLTGKSDFEVNLPGVDSIQGESFIAVGDFNADIKDGANPGGVVLKNLFSKANLWVKESEASFTNEGKSFEPSPFRLMLDYIVTSPNIVPIKGKIIHPDFKRVELGCGDEAKTQSQEGMVLKTYFQNRLSCNVLVTEEYEAFKKASDHYPIWGHFQIK